MKPYDGGGWVGVIEDRRRGRAARGLRRQRHQDRCTCRQAVIPYDWFVRCVGLGPQTRVVNYDPSAPLHDRYRMDRGFLTAEQQQSSRT